MKQIEEEERKTMGLNECIEFKKVNIGERIIYHWDAIRLERVKGNKHRFGYGTIIIMLNVLQVKNHRYFNNCKF